MNELKKTSQFIHFYEDKTLRNIITGEIDHHSAKKIRDDIDELIFENRPTRLYLNFSNVEFLDSSGLGLIMGRYKLMKIYGGTTFIEDPSHRVLKIIELAQMNRIIEIVSTQSTDGEIEGGKNNEEK